MTNDMTSLYSSYSGVTHLFQTQTKSIKQQFEMGVRAFDLRVNYVKTKKLTNRWDKFNYYYCDMEMKDTDKIECYDFRFYNDVFPVSNTNMTGLMKELTGFLDTYKTETIILRLTCTPYDWGCEKDKVMNMLVEGFFRKYQGTN